MTVAVLFARSDSYYKSLPGCDVWDAERDARRWLGAGQCAAAAVQDGRADAHNIEQRPASRRDTVEGKAGNDQGRTGTYPSRAGDLADRAGFKV